jgi:hypothetical protein
MGVVGDALAAQHRNDLLLTALEFAAPTDRLAAEMKLVHDDPANSDNDPAVAPLDAIDVAIECFP